MNIQLQTEFDNIFGYWVVRRQSSFWRPVFTMPKKISFACAAHMAGLNFASFKSRLLEHFNQGYILAEECVFEDMHTTSLLK